MSNATNYGTIHNYQTGDLIRSASHDDWSRSVMHGDKYTGAFLDIDGTKVYLDGGPKTVEEQADEATNFFQR